MALRFTISYLEDSLTLVRYYKQLAEGAMAQAADDHLFLALNEETNSIAVIVNHMTKNMISRWTDFLTTDGEKPGRDRDREFSEPPTTRQDLMDRWNEGWQCVFTALEPLTDADLTRTITIRGEPHSVTQAINRQMAHYSYHVGQIVFLAKQLRASEWKCLSIPRGQSSAFNQKVAKGQASQR